MKNLMYSHTAGFSAFFCGCCNSIKVIRVGGLYTMSTDKPLADLHLKRVALFVYFCFCFVYVYSIE